MKFFTALLTIAVAPLALAAPATAGTFSVATYRSESCASSSTLVETIAGTDAYAGHCFSLAQLMPSFNFNMNGGCNTATFYFDRACDDNYGGYEYTNDGGSIQDICHTNSNGLVGSFKVTC